MAEYVEQVTENYDHVFRRDLLKGKVAFVTGGATGIGFTITEILMRYGCDVAIASRNLGRLQNAKRLLESATGQKCFIAQMDVRNPKDVVKTVQDILGEYKRLDILVNNAAGNFLSPASSLSFNAFKTVMEIDAHGTFNVSKAVYENFFKDHGGVIVNISATLHYKGSAFQTHASAAKAAIDTMTKCLANEWGSEGIRVVGVAPGPIGDTEGMRRLGGKSPHAGRLTEMIPLQRYGHRYEMANAVVFLASSAGSYVTGETLVADGGSWLSQPNSMHFAKMLSKI